MLRNVLWIAGLGVLVWIGAQARTFLYSPLMTAFHATGASATGYSVNDWVVANAPNPRELMQDLAHRLNVNAPLRRHSGAYLSLTESKESQEASTTLIVDRLPDGALFVLANRTSGHGFTGIAHTQALFALVLGQLGMVHSDINLMGTLAGDLSTQREKTLMRKALAAVGATPLSGPHGQPALSVTADSAQLGSPEQLHGHSVNVQIIITDVTAQREAKIVIGSPLITVPY